MRRLSLTILFFLSCLTAFGQIPDSILFAERLDSLEEVVVVGYGMVRKSDLTGAVTSIRVDEDEASRATSLDRLIQGRAAGVQIVSNGGGPDGGISYHVSRVGIRDVFRGDPAPREDERISAFRMSADFKA